MEEMNFFAQPDLGGVDPEEFERSLREANNKWKDASKAERGAKLVITETYFTPSIEDIRVGYECELLDVATAGWFPFKFKGNEDFLYLHEDMELKDVLDGYLRVPYLTKEQIEAEGWVYESFPELEEYGMKDYSRNKVKIRHDEYNRRVKFDFIDYSSETTNPMGKRESLFATFDCKDINTFRYICKLLGI